MSECQVQAVLKNVPCKHQMSQKHASKLTDHNRGLGEENSTGVNSLK